MDNANGLFNATVVDDEDGFEWRMSFEQEPILDEEMMKSIEAETALVKDLWRSKGKWKPPTTETLLSTANARTTKEQ